MHLAGVENSLNAVLCLQLLCCLSQVHLSQFVQHVVQQRPVQHSTCPWPSLCPHPQHLVVSLPAGAMIQLCLFDLCVPHTERTHQLLYLQHRNQIQHSVDQLRDWEWKEKEIRVRTILSCIFEPKQTGPVLCAIWNTLTLDFKRDTVRQIGRLLVFGHRTLRSTFENVVVWSIWLDQDLLQDKEKSI